MQPQVLRAWDTHAARSDGLILGRIRPDLDGLSIVRALRNAQIRTPALNPSAPGAIDDEAFGIPTGGDDYPVPQNKAWTMKCVREEMF